MAQAASKTCEICISAIGSQYCLECEQYFCENCKTFHSRQKISKTHQFQSSSDVIPEGKSFISEMRTQQTMNRERELPSPKSDYKQEVKPKERGRYPGNAKSVACKCQIQNR
ncbi:Hypothetical predicted protein [Mytilus galloprovincialis]|uniref:B box-type domain-containing protein n=1 Tax=Mytilus galloprovincialis TaxID=29158 RepID=A0A8B6BL34_MYTGA|nr:Hypothetical predicted protein [Mytilus galloprovincialis]